MSKHVALITGITGQDGSYLAELLLSHNYEVHGVVRRASTINTSRIDHLLSPVERIHLHFGQLGDGIDGIIAELKPDEIYNIGSQSHVRVSFDIPIYTGRITGLGSIRILESIRRLGLAKKTKYYQASSSEQFGISPPPQYELTPMLPVSPYGCAKLYSYHATRTYRRGYGMFAANGILFNHESSRRGKTFVTRKITRAVARIKLGLQKELVLGNLDAKRDWGHAKDYCKAMWLIMQHSEPDDFVVATGHYYTIKEFVEAAFTYLDLDPWRYITFDDRYKRPCEVPALLGDASKIKRILGWEPEIDFYHLVAEMVDNDLRLAKQELLLKRGF